VVVFSSWAGGSVASTSRSDWSFSRDTDDLPEQASTLREEGTGRARLDARPLLHEGLRQRDHGLQWQGARADRGDTRAPRDKGSDVADVDPTHAEGERMTVKVWRESVLELSTRFPMARWSPIPLRLIVGFGFMQHGFAKLSRGPGAFVAILQ